MGYQDHFRKQLSELKELLPKGPKLLVDDRRSIDVDVVCRSVEGFRLLRNSLPLFDLIIFDNNLGELVQGHQLLHQMLNDWTIFPKEIWIIVTRPCAKKKMETTLSHFGYEEDRRQCILRFLNARRFVYRR